MVRVFALIWLVLACLPANGAIPIAVDNGFERVRNTCLQKYSLPIYKPRFGPLDESNKTGPGSAFNKKILNPTIVGIPEGNRTELARSYQALKNEIDAYIDANELNDYQRACVYQCAATSYFESGQPGVGVEALLGARRKDFKRAKGDCVHTSLFAYDLGKKHLDVAISTTSYFRNLARASGHAFTVVKLDGKKYVMNNNWGIQEVCLFRTDK